MMDDKSFKKQLDDLIVEISTLPKDEKQKFQDLAKETETRHEDMKKTSAVIQESIDFLRLSIKYVVFDLEATQRENEYLRKLLDQERD